MQKRKQKIEAKFLIRFKTNKKSVGARPKDTPNHTFTPLTRSVRGTLWLTLFCLIFGSVAFVLPQSDAKVAGLATVQHRSGTVGSAATGVVVADISTQSSTSDPGFVITSQNPQDQCFIDSYYTASPQVWLEFFNATDKYNQVQIVTKQADFVNNQNWIDFFPSPPSSPRPTCSNGAVVMIQRDLTNLFGNHLKNGGTGLMTIYARFRNNGGTPSAAVSDSIYFGYPFIATQRGDVHTNDSSDAAINGDASGTNSPLIMCNPPVPSQNADYVVSMGKDGKIKTVTGVDSGLCSNQVGNVAPTFGTRSGTGATVNLNQDVHLDAGTSSLVNRATSICQANQTLFIDSSTGRVNVSTCSPGPSSDLSHGQIIELRAADPSVPEVTTLNGGTINNGALNQSGMVTLFSTGPVSVNVVSDIVYESSTGTINNLNQLASFSILLKNGNITIHKDVRVLAGIYYAETGTINTSSPNAAKRPLSLYGSLIANDIVFGRNFLGSVNP